MAAEMTSVRSLASLRAAGRRSPNLAGAIYGTIIARRDDVRRVMSREWPLFQSSFPLAVPLALGSLGLLGRETALGLATLVGMGTLVAWGVGLARREGYGVAGIVGAATVNAVVGMLIIGVKVAVG